MSKRERLIAAAVGASIGIFVLDSVVVEPLIAKQDTLSAEISREQDELRNDRNLVRSMPILRQRWNDNMARGLFSDQPSAEGQLLAKLQELAVEHNLTVTRLSPSATATAVQRVGSKTGDASKDKPFMRMTARFNASGNMSQVSQFIWQLHHCEIPVHITELAVETAKEATDDLKINMQVATIFLAPEKAGSENATQVAQGGSATRPVATTASRTTAGVSTTQPNRTETR